MIIRVCHHDQEHENHLQNTRTILCSKRGSTFPDQHALRGDNE